ncbi:multiprotein-bridging factor 1 family protein [Rhizobium sp. SGZ-381]|uniref:helix-turn-helix domain-containing protein n=1 Tax=Rhizobium sp. SGZ-381 TaxID=3342800 RepID=UPI00366AA847
MITAEQIRAARAMIGMPLETLARESGLSVSDVEGLERGVAVGVDTARLRQCLEHHGIVFLATGEDDPGVGPGLRLRHAPADEGMRPENLNADNDG